MCGGTRGVRRGVDGAEGLSPRVRGNRAGWWYAPGQPGSIPACAGEPVKITGLDLERRVYPRVCGGTPCAATAAPSSPGLSPRVRGNHRAGGAGGAQPRSIPACAGEPGCAAPQCSRAWVYPRVCGGTPASWNPVAAGQGLSPRVRGNRNGVAPASGNRRSIPACAGEPGRTGMTPGYAGVYPRVCGGTAAGQRNPVAAGGLSPRVRGNPSPTA